MDAAAAGVASASSAATWRRTVRRRSLGAGALPRPREDTAAAEMEAAVWRLRAEKDTAERAAAALRAELDAERGAAGTAASEAMLMIGRLQREKAAAMMEARQFRGLAEGRAGMDRQLQDRLAAVSAVAASYAAQLRTHGVDPEENDGEGDGEDDDYEEHNEAEADGEDQDGDGVVEKAAVVEVLEDTSPSPSPSPSPAEEFVYTVDVPCATEKMAAAAERVDAGAAAGLSLQARVEALEADREAVRREAAAARVERAQVALAREVARRLFLEAAARTMVARTAAAVAPPEAPRFSVVAICKKLVHLHNLTVMGKEAFCCQADEDSETGLPQPPCLEPRSPPADAPGGIQRRSSDSEQSPSVT
ncbi:hypothetical protein ACP4OV_011753 [Aristida adscensionis]